MAPTNTSTLAPVGPAPALATVGEIANRHAAAASFADYRSRKSPQTLRRHDAALTVFSYYLAIVHVQAEPARLGHASRPPGRDDVGPGRRLRRLAARARLCHRHG